MVSERKPACPAAQAGHLPSADHGIQDPVRTGEEVPPVAEGQFVDPVHGDQVARIEIGDCPVQLGIEGVENLAETCVAGECGRIVRGSAVALGVRAQIDGLAKRVAEIRLEAVLHRMAHDELSGVIAAGADGGHGGQVAVLARVVAIMRPPHPGLQRMSML